MPLTGHGGSSPPSDTQSFRLYLSGVVSTGWAREGRPAASARNLARTRKPWSSQYLMRIGRDDVIAYFVGRLAGKPTGIPPGIYGSSLRELDPKSE